MGDRQLLEGELFVLGRDSGCVDGAVDGGGEPRRRRGGKAANDGAVDEERGLFDPGFGIRVLVASYAYSIRA